MKKLYYVVEKELNSDGEVEFTTGNKNVTVYQIVDNQMVKFADIELQNDDNTVRSIYNYLDDNGHSDESFSLQQL
jgi:hypothetical protein